MLWQSISHTGVDVFTADATVSPSSGNSVLRLRAKGPEINLDMTLVMPGNLARRYADAINAVNAAAEAQAAHDARLSDAGIQEYRNLIAEIA